MLKGYKLLTAYVVVAYIAQGIAEHFCLPSQPLNNYFVKEQNWQPTKLAAYLAFLMVPWTIKPVFGAISDAIRLGDSSKRNYLTAVFALSAAGYLLAALASENCMTIGLFIAACGLAWGTALLLGMIIERFPARLIPYVFSLHFISYYSASICSGIVGGRLCQHLTPTSALITAFTVSAAICLLAAALTPLWVTKDDAVTEVSSDRFKKAVECLKNRDFWLVAAFIYCWSFSPAFGTPLYFQYTKVLKISQESIGQANACCSFGMLAGAFVYPLIWRTASRYQVHIAIGLSITSTLCFLQLNASNFTFLEFSRGLSGMLGVLCINWLAARVAPRGLETFATASLIGMYNVGTQSSGIIGAYLYSHLFAYSLNPLLLLTVSITPLCALVYVFISNKVRSTKREIGK